MQSQSLQDILNQLHIFKAEIFIGLGAILVLILGIFRGKMNTKIFVLLYFFVVLSSLFFVSSSKGFFFNSFFFLDDYSYFLKILFLVSTLLIFLFDRKEHQIEFYFLLIAVLLGCMFMVTSIHLLMIYIAVEWVSYGSYLLSGFYFSKKNAEATLKYFIFGSVVAAVMLFGISLLYGSSSSLYLDDLEANTTTQIGLLMFFGGLWFKMAIFPFHIWVPSTYESAPTDAVAFISTVPKLAGIGLTFHILSMLQVYVYEVKVLFVILSILTIMLGTFAALNQKNLKRLIAYGAIAHSGFLLPIILFQNSNEIFFTYALIYALMNIGIFYFIFVFEKELGHDVSLYDIEGLGKNNLWLGVSGLVILTSLIGLPPTGGFKAKFYMLLGVWNEYTLTNEKVWTILFIVAVLSTLLSLFYYLQIPYYFFLKKKDTYLKVYSKTKLIITLIFALTMLLLFFCNI